MNRFKLLILSAVLIIAPVIGNAQSTTEEQFIDIIQINKASVVVVTVEQLPFDMQTKIDDAFEDLEDFGFPKGFLDSLTPDKLKEDKVPPRKRISFGTGFFIEDYIVTNYHVIDNAETIVINFEGNPTRYEVEVMNSDEISDLAILKLKNPLPFDVISLQWSNTPLRSGQSVWAIGHPRGLEYSISKGIVSSTDRTASNNWQKSVQTDVAINAGNSGGPLFDMDGNVVAINTIIVTSSGGSDGISVSVESNYAQDIIKRLLTGEEIDRPLMGIQLADKIMTGEVFVAALSPGKGGANAGVEDDDIFYILDGDIILFAQDVFEVLRRHRPGDTISAIFLRGDDREQVTLEIVLSSLLQAREESEADD